MTKNDEIQLLEKRLKQHQAIWVRVLAFVDDPLARVSDRMWAKEFLTTLIPAGADLRGRLATARARVN